MLALKRGQTHFFQLEKNHFYSLLRNIEQEGGCKAAAAAAPQPNQKGEIF